MEENPYIKAFDRLQKLCEQARKGLITAEEFEDRTMEVLLELGGDRYKGGLEDGKQGTTDKAAR